MEVGPAVDREQSQLKPKPFHRGVQRTTRRHYYHQESEGQYVPPQTHLVWAIMAPIHRNICPKDVPDDFKSQPAAWLSTLFAQGGNGTRVYLAQDSLWELEGTISVRVDDAELATEGTSRLALYILSDTLT